MLASSRCCYVIVSRCAFFRPASWGTFSVGSLSLVRCAAPECGKGPNSNNRCLYEVLYET